MMDNVEKKVYNDKILCIIVRAKTVSELNEEMLFATPDYFPFQMGIHNRKKDSTCTAHAHLPFPELKDFPVQEFFYVVSGKVKINLFDERENDQLIDSVIINTGDSIVLNCAHGFEFLEDSKLVELKQGPYRGKEKEKRFFNENTSM